MPNSLRINVTFSCEGVLAYMSKKLGWQSGVKHLVWKFTGKKSTVLVHLSLENSIYNHFPAYAYTELLH